METLQIEYKDGYAIVFINNGKVNAISRQVALELAEAFNQLEENKAVKGVVLTGKPHCFSAGLDLVSLIGEGIEDTKAFFRAYYKALKAMICFSKPFVCAITGYAPAGATIFTLCADYRIMGKGQKHVVGLHEFKLSMQIPEIFCDIYSYYLGEQQAWKHIQNSRLFNSDEAMEIGLVHESVDVEVVLEKAEKHVQKMIRVYEPVVIKTKGLLRKGLLKLVDKPFEPVIEVLAKEWEDPFVKTNVTKFLESLKK